MLHVTTNSKRPRYFGRAGTDWPLLFTSLHFDSRSEISMRQPASQCQAVFETFFWVDFAFLLPQCTSASPFDGQSFPHFSQAVGTGGLPFGLTATHLVFWTSGADLSTLLRKSTSSCRSLARSLVNSSIFAFNPKIANSTRRTVEIYVFARSVVCIVNPYSIFSARLRFSTSLGWVTPSPIPRQYSHCRAPLGYWHSGPPMDLY